MMKCRYNHSPHDWFQNLEPTYVPKMGFTIKRPTVHVQMGFGMQCVWCIFDKQKSLAALQHVHPDLQNAAIKIIIIVFCCSAAKAP